MTTLLDLSGHTLEVDFGWEPGAYADDGHIEIDALTLCMEEARIPLTGDSFDAVKAYVLKTEGDNLTDAYAQWADGRRQTCREGGKW